MTSILGFGHERSVEGELRRKTSKDNIHGAVWYEVPDISARGLVEASTTPGRLSSQPRPPQIAVSSPLHSTNALLL